MEIFNQKTKETVFANCDKNPVNKTETTYWECLLGHTTWHILSFVCALAPAKNLHFQAVLIHQEHDAGSMLDMFARSC
jgi:hypothetical protein